MAVLRQEFPEHTDQIERLRSTDLVFAEICRDYETLLHLLPRDADDPYGRDIRRSLNGLKEEIRSFLGLPDPARCPRPTPTNAALHKMREA